MRSRPLRSVTLVVYLEQDAYSELNCSSCDDHAATTTQHNPNSSFPLPLDRFDCPSALSRFRRPPQFLATTDSCTTSTVESWKKHGEIRVARNVCGPSFCCHDTELAQGHGLLSYQGGKKGYISIFFTRATTFTIALPSNYQHGQGSKCYAKEGSCREPTA